MKVLSLFDGISCGMVALERAGIPVERYVAYEIEPNAIKISKKNYPNIEQCGDTAVIPTGLAIEIPSSEYAAFIFARSGLSVKHGIGLLNSVGVIDSDYRGELKVGVINQKRESYTIMPGERIAQLVIMPVSCMPVCEVSELSDTDRGEGGFGSTGKK